MDWINESVTMLTVHFIRIAVLNKHVNNAPLTTFDPL